QTSCSVHAPPTRARASSTRTRWPALARYAAQASPLCPAPTTIASHRLAARSRIEATRSSTPIVSADGLYAAPRGIIATIPPISANNVIEITVRPMEIARLQRLALVWNKRPWYSNEQEKIGDEGSSSPSADQRVVNWMKPAEQRPDRSLRGKGG